MIHLIGIFAAVLAALWTFDAIKARRRRKAIARALYNINPGRLVPNIPTAAFEPDLRLYPRDDAPFVTPTAPVVESDTGWHGLMNAIIAFAVAVVLACGILSLH